MYKILWKMTWKKVSAKLFGPLEHPVYIYKMRAFLAAQTARLF